MIIGKRNGGEHGVGYLGVACGVHANQSLELGAIGVKFGALKVSDAEALYNRLAVSIGVAHPIHFRRNKVCFAHGLLLIVLSTVHFMANPLTAFAIDVV
ncbi:hypothetical protein GCM10023078_31750 [Gibbsiella greigii]